MTLIKCFCVMRTVRLFVYILPINVPFTYLHLYLLLLLSICSLFHFKLITVTLFHPFSGEVLHWRELCRIQHLPTRQYLAVVKVKESYKVTLKARSADKEFEEDATFRLVPVIEGNDDVNFGSYARIYHLHTESWLHALEGTVCSYTLHRYQR